MATVRRSRMEWEQLVAEVDETSVKEVARHHGLRAQTLTWWRWQLRRGTVARSATKAAKVQMVPVRVRREVPAGAAVPDVIEVVVRSAVLRVRIGQDARYIAELAAALAARC